LSIRASAAQQFSLNSFYSDKGWYSEVLQAQKGKLLGFRPLDRADKRAEGDDLEAIGQHRGLARKWQLWGFRWREWGR
jgi:hypothetical protein